MTIMGNRTLSVPHAQGPATVYRVEHRVDGVGPFDRDGFCGQRFRYLEMMRGVDAKSAFLSPWALLCYFGSTLPIAACYGYLAALYVAPVLREDHTGQCLIPVDAQPLRRVPLLDLALLAGEGE